MKVKDIVATLGGDISTKNSKMPGTAFGLSATACHVGSKLQGKRGTTCEKCYALRLEKLRPSVHKGYMNRTVQAQRLEHDDDHFDRWVEAAAIRIRQLTAKLGQPYHRWHDSGDLQSYAHFQAIVSVAWLVPEVQFWLPTREKAIVREFCRHNQLPDNLVVRLSATMVDGLPPEGFTHTSTVASKNGIAVGHRCPASQQDNNCGDCRSCWDVAVGNVAYPIH